jgi:cyclase
MLAKRIIPSVLVRGKTAYKGPGFGQACTRSVGSALAVCRTHARRGVDELLILDIGATPEGRGPDLELVKQLSDECFIPITVGGGVKTLEDIDALLRAGADKVAIGAAARQDVSLLTLARDRFGAQALVGIVEHDDDQWSEAVRVACEMDCAGAGEIVLQHRGFREGSCSGYDCIAAIVSSGIGCPLIISGGCSGPADMLAAIRAGADGVAALPEGQRRGGAAVILRNVYSCPAETAPYLYDLLAERTPEQSISHKEMPTYERHLAFVIGSPYYAWYLITTDDTVVGAIYLTRQWEIGIGIFRAHQRRGYARQAIEKLMDLHGRNGRYLANINPANEASIALFRKLGFGGPSQITLEKP